MKHKKVTCPRCGALVDVTHQGKVGVHLQAPKVRCATSGKHLERIIKNGR